MARPTSCDGDTGPQVCGCDGVVYANRCEAELHGHDVGPTSMCATPPGTIACGEFCSPDEICFTFDPYDDFEQGPLVGCSDPPDACEGALTCDCLTANQASQPLDCGSGVSCTEKDGFIYFSCSAE